MKDDDVALIAAEDDGDATSVSGMDPVARAVSYRNQYLKVGLVFFVIAVLFFAVFLAWQAHKPAPPAPPPPPGNPSPSIFARGISDDNIFASLEHLYAIALNGSVVSRSVVNTYDECAAWIELRLSEAGGYYKVSRQWLAVPVWEEVSPATLNITVSTGIIVANPGRDFINLRYGGDADGVLHVIDRANGDGCNTSDYPVIVVGQVIAVSDVITNCDLYYKALLAMDSGAAGILFYPRAPSDSIVNGRVRAVNWTLASRNVTIPAFAVSYTIGQLLQDGILVHMTADNTLTVAYTSNVLAETVAGATNETVVVGAHLDSVDTGPGINDNGSGAATVLEIALQLARDAVNVSRRVQFAWWAAEELGLLGSRHFVNTLTAGERRNISHALNFDMLASPNYVRQVYNGSTAPAAAARAGSTEIQETVEGYFQSQRLAYAVVPMSTVGGSDYFPFAQAGIPTGGIATGASEIKTTLQRDIFGGLAQAPLDPCYHLSCDSVPNINRQGLKEMVQAAAFLTYRYIVN